MTTVAGVAGATGPASLTILRALNAAAATVDNVTGTPAQKAYGRAARILDAAAFHGLVASRVFPEWAQRIGPDADAWCARLLSGGETWHVPISGLAPPTATLDSNPYAFATRIMQVAGDAAAIWGVGAAGAWNPALANSDPPPEWLQDTYNAVYDVAAALPIIGWIVEALMWLIGGIASWFTSYADEVFATSRPTISPEAVQAALDLMASVRLSFESVLQRAKGAGWSQGMQAQHFSQQSKAITGAAASPMSNTSKAAIVVGATSAALLLVWVLMA